MDCPPATAVSRAVEREGRDGGGRERRSEKEMERGRERERGKDDGPMSRQVASSHGPHPPSRLHPYGEDENLDGHARVTR